MTRPISRKMAVDCLLWYVQQPGNLIVMHDQEEGGPFYVFKCYLCGKPILPGQTIQFDHLHATVHGGSHEYTALRPVHYDPCHKKKQRGTSRQTQKSNAF
jgi:5-methylcytosine-specific restriction endonuclease McrA